MWVKTIKGRMGEGCKNYSILSDLSLVSESDCTWFGGNVQLVSTTQWVWETAVVFWWLSDDWLNVMLRRFMQSLIFLKVCVIPLQLLAVGELLGFWLIFLYFFSLSPPAPLHPVVFNWQHIVQSQCCQFFLLQWCVCWSNLLWPALGSLWEEESLSHR